MRHLILIPFFAFAFQAHAYFQMDFMKNKAANRASSRWTLGDWLAQKNKNALADHWLAMNRSANIFETNLSGGINNYKLKTSSGAATTSTNHDSQAYQLDFYISLFNITGEYEKTDNDIEAYGGALGLRLFGNSSQTTNLVARYGLRKLQNLDSQESWDNQYAEGQLQLYIVSFFGLTGKYRYYFPDESKLGNKLEGSRSTAGAFLEFGILRLYGEAYQEPMVATMSGVKVNQKREGFEYGAKLFF